MSEDPTTQRPPVSGIIGLVAVIVGVVAMAVSFVVGIGVALQASGNGALPYEIAFLVGLALVIGAIALAIVHAVRGQGALLAVFTIAIGAVPLLTVIGGLLFALVGH